MSLELEIPCEECGKDCTHVLCQKHFQEMLDDAYTEGKKEGHSEGYESARAEFEKTE
jgi:hypothetical protein